MYDDRSETETPCTVMRYRLAIFDFDGTLADSLAWFTSQWNDIAGRMGCRAVSPEEAEALRHCGSREVFRRVGLPLWKFPLVAREYRRRQAADPAGVKLFTGAAEALTRLVEAGVVLAIVSSNGEENIRNVLGRELAGRVSHYGCGASLFGKASKFKAVLRRAGVRAEDAVTVGDELRDLDAARAAGIAAMAVSWGYATAAALRARGPEHFVETCGQLVDVILGVPPA